MNNWKKRFAVIWAGQLFSILSSNAAQFAIVLWISLKTGSAEALSFAAIAALLPQMTLKVFSGTPYQVSLIEILFGVGTLAGGLLPPCCRSGSKHRLRDGCSCCSTASAFRSAGGRISRRPGGYRRDFRTRRTRYGSDCGSRFLIPSVRNLENGSRA
jgi:hypothetical protein